MSDDSGHVTQLLEKVKNGDQTAQSELAKAMSQQLKRLAAQLLSQERPGHSFRPSDLVQEAFLQILGKENKEWEDRKHFIRSAALVMRHILVDHGRKHDTLKRRDARHSESLEEKLELSIIPGLNATIALTPEQIENLLPLHQALEELEREYPRPAEVIQLRVFAGQTENEIAAILGVVPRTVSRDYQFAKAWLRRRLGK